MSFVTADEQSLEAEPRRHPLHRIGDGIGGIEAVQFLNELKGFLPENLRRSCHWLSLVAFFDSGWIRQTRQHQLAQSGPPRVKAGDNPAKLFRAHSFDVAASCGKQGA